MEDATFFLKCPDPNWKPGNYTETSFIDNMQQLVVCLRISFTWASHLSALLFPPNYFWNLNCDGKKGLKRLMRRWSPPELSMIPFVKWNIRWSFIFHHLIKNNAKVTAWVCRLATRLKPIERSTLRDQIVCFFFGSQLSCNTKSLKCNHHNARNHWTCVCFTVSVHEHPSLFSYLLTIHQRMTCTASAAFSASAASKATGRTCQSTGSSPLCQSECQSWLGQSSQLGWAGPTRQTSKHCSPTSQIRIVSEALIDFGGKFSASAS